jgi:hypothetical protein
MLAVIDTLWIAKKSLEHKLSLSEQENASLKSMLTYECEKYDRLQEKLKTCQTLFSDELDPRISHGDWMSNISKRENTLTISKAEFSQCLHILMNGDAHDEFYAFDSTVKDNIGETRRNLAMMRSAVIDNSRREILCRDTLWRKRVARIKILSAWKLFCVERHACCSVMSSGDRRWKSHLRSSAFLVWAASTLEAVQNRAITALELQVLHARAPQKKFQAAA